MSLSMQDVAEQLYDWSFRDAERELREGFPLVARIRGANAEKYVRFLSDLATTEASAASRALVKRMNQPTLLRKGPILTGEEAAHVEAYLNSGQVIGKHSSKMLVVNSEEFAVKKTRETQKALKALVQERFRGDFGVADRLGANEWRYEIETGRIHVRTYLDVGGRSSLTYNHSILLSNKSLFSAPISLLQWLGAASMTRWRVLRAEELQDAADTVAAVARHFIAQMRLLFE